MKTKYALFIYLLLTITIACKKESSEPGTVGFKAPIITGFYLRDVYGGTVGQVGQPNVNLGVNDTFGNSLLVYPIPSVNDVNINLLLVNNPTENTLVWVVRVTPQGQDLSFNFQNRIYFPAENLPLFTIDKFNKGYNNISISSWRYPLSAGYYRIYARVDNVLLYDNFVITNQRPI